MVAKAREPFRRQFYRQDGEFWVIVFPKDWLVEPVGEQYRPVVTEEGLHGNAGRKRLSVAVIVPPANLYIFRSGIITTGRPTTSRNIGSFYGESGVQASVVNNVNSLSGR